MWRPQTRTVIGPDGIPHVITLPWSDAQNAALGDTGPNPVSNQQPGLAGDPRRMGLLKMGLGMMADSTGKAPGAAPQQGIFQMLMQNPDLLKNIFSKGVK